MAESELAVLAGQCLDRRIPSQDVLQHETGAWQEQRNLDAIRVHWRFTTGGRPHQTKVPLPINTEVDPVGWTGLGHN